MDIAVLFLVVLLVIGVIAWATGIRIINEYERGVVLRLGRLMRPKGPGLRVIIPFGIDKLIKVDLRTVTLEVPPQEAITIDNVTVTVLAVIYFQVVQPHLAVTAVQNYYNATSQIAQSTLRSVLGQCSLHDLLAERAKLNASLQRFIDEQTEPWGIKVTAVEIKDVEMPESMQRAMARQAEAEREKAAKIISAEGEFEAAQKLADAAGVIGTAPGALQLRYMQTLAEIGEEQNTVIVFPLPMEFVEPLLEMRGKAAPRPVLSPDASDLMRRFATRGPKQGGAEAPSPPPSDAR
jgi:regulator of protease activity HflC (stomatin/prohibitin superfamily)